VRHFDIAIVGAGILGLAHALAAARRGQRVVVLERDAQANGASIRNFGFVTVTGQEAGDCWRLARRSRDIWAEVVASAQIPVLHSGLVVAARRPESEAVIEAFLTTDMGAECQRLPLAQARQQIPALSQRNTAALYSPHELRVESREAIPRLAAWLAEAHGVEFRWNTAVHAVESPSVTTSAGTIEAGAVILCPGDSYTGPFADNLNPPGLTRCKLHMLRVRPAAEVQFGAALMSDLGLARYRGYADLPEAKPLKALLDEEQAAQRRNGVHLIAVQSADGSLIVGDSHHYSQTPDPFQPEWVDDLMLEEFDAVVDLPGRRVVERWLGTYASADNWLYRDAPAETVRRVIVTAGCGASTAFGIAEETLEELSGALT
jgi:FAD dependent oxidoreductase TIGR03364